MRFCAQLKPDSGGMNAIITKKRENLNWRRDDYFGLFACHISFVSSVRHHYAVVVVVSNEKKRENRPQQWRMETPKIVETATNSRGEIQRDQRIHTNRCNSTENHRQFESDAFPVSQLPLSWCLQKTKTDIIRVYWLHGFRFVQQKVSINIITQTRTTNSGLINTKHTNAARENS